MMTGLQTLWGWLLSIDLFLGGLGAAAFCAAAVIGLVRGDRFKSTVRFSAWAAAIAIGLGALALLADVGQPFRAIILFKSFVNLNSWMTRGAWTLTCALVLDGLAALFWTDWSLTLIGRIWRPLEERRHFLRALLAVVGIPVNLGVAAYTGMLLSVLQFRPLWNTWFLPLLFVASALVTGVALVGGYAAIFEKGPGARRLKAVLGVIMLVLIGGQAVVLREFLWSALGGKPEAVASVRLIVGGPLSVLFWVLVVAGGLAVPFLMYLLQLSGLLRRAAIPVAVLATAGCLAGGWTLRFVVLSAGMPQALASPAWQQILAGIRLAAR
jgi:formate-dependent nitrite reductase membrane component NrfD